MTATLASGTQMEMDRSTDSAVRGANCSRDAATSEKFWLFTFDSGSSIHEMAMGNWKGSLVRNTIGHQWSEIAIEEFPA